VDRISVGRSVLPYIKGEIVLKNIEDIPVLRKRVISGSTPRKGEEHDQDDAVQEYLFPGSLVIYLGTGMNYTGVLGLQATDCRIRNSPHRLPFHPLQDAVVLGLVQRYGLGVFPGVLLMSMRPVPLLLVALLARLPAMGTEFVFENDQFSFQALRTAGYCFSGGSDLGECLSTCGRIADGDVESWHREWLDTAMLLEAKADSFLDAGCIESAGDCYFRASEYYRAAEFFLHVDPFDPRMIETWRMSRDAFLLGASLSGDPIVMVEIPFENSYLPAYLCLVDETDAERPFLIAHSGFDGTKEELYFSLGRYAVDRGYNCLLFEGPGQGEVIREQGIHFRPDWENVVSPVVDYVMGLPYVDPDRVVLIGYSMGGYLAPRAVTREHRIAACVADGGLYSMYESAARTNPPNLDEILQDEDASAQYDDTIYGMMDGDLFVRWYYNNGMWTFGADSPSQFMRMMQAYTLEGCVKDISCSVLILNSENDQLILGQAAKLYDSLSCPRQYVMFTEAQGADEHCQMGAVRVSNETIFCWLEEVLSELE
jgi:pimeloyl-ACP methyl ester carboxylesterase